MNILICDDDKLYVDMIRKYVDEFFDEHKITDYKVYEYNSGDEAAKKVKSKFVCKFIFQLCGFIYATFIFKRFD